MWWWLSMFHWDWTINVGTLVALISAGLLVATPLFRAVKAAHGLMVRLDRLETKMEPVWLWFTTELKDLHVTQVNVERKK